MPQPKKTAGEDLAESTLFAFKCCWIIVMVVIILAFIGFLGIACFIGTSA